MLASGSSGNATYVEAQGQALLLDAGIGPRTLARRLSVIERHPDAVSLLLLTHEHGDHIGGLPALTRRRRLTVAASSGTLARVRERLQPGTATITLQAGRRKRIGPWRVEPVRVRHDAAEPLAYVIEADGARLGYATDFGCTEPELARALRAVDALVIESNHDTAMLRDGPYPAALKRRIFAATGHLSNQDLCAFLASLELERCRSITLAHLSQHNNTPELALASARQALGGGSRRLRLRVASQREPLPLETVLSPGRRQRPTASAPRTSVQLAFSFLTLPSKQGA